MITQQPPIRFKRNPSAISAICAYMGPELYSQKWVLKEGRYSNWGMQEQIQAQNVISISIDELHLNDNRFNMIKEISGVSFPQLRTLNLDGNNIMTLIPLRQLQMPNLSYLSLRNNLIRNLNDLKFWHFHVLRTIDLRMNVIIDLEGLTKLGKSMIEVLLESAKEHKVQGEDFRLLIKMESINMDWIFAVSHKRILVGESFKRCIGNRWKECSFKVAGEQRRLGNVAVRNLLHW